MERNEGGGAIGNQNTMFLHIDVDLSRFKISWEFCSRLISLIFIQFFDFFLLVREFYLPSLELDLKFLDKLLVQ